MAPLCLDVATFPVERAVLDDRTAYADGVLRIDAGAVARLVLRDPRIADVRLDLAHPGESVRILRALDSIEPLFKVSGPGTAFPGWATPPVSCGGGVTHRLAGLAVVAVTDFPFPASGVQAFEEGIVEMSGPGADYSGLADRVNLLLALTPGATSSNADYDDAVRRAGLRVADYLAGATRSLSSASIERFELSAVARPLPRVVWVHQVRAQGPMVQTYLYGHELTGMVPTILHPNELLDGALVGANYKTGSKTPTSGHTRHPSLLALYDRHGRDVDFAGVIVARGHHETEFLKQRSAHFVARLARMLGARGALCTYEATGNTHIDFMLTVQALEQAGVRTSAVVHEYGGPDGADPSLVDFVPEAVALASGGGIDRRVRLPAVGRVIGGDRLAHRGERAADPLDLPIQELYATTIEMNARGFVARDALPASPQRAIEPGRRLRVVHYVNQFFAGLGGESEADAPAQSRPGAVGPGRALQEALGANAEIVGTVICGDGRFDDRSDETADAILALVHAFAPDVVIAGPAFGSGRYGLACGRVCVGAIERLAVPAVAAMHPDNAGVEVYRRDVPIVPTAASARGMGAALVDVARAAVALARGQELEAGAVIASGRRLNARTDRPASARALAILVARLHDAPFTSEVPLPAYDRVVPPAPIGDMTRARLALITEGGLVPRGNPDRLEWVRASKWMRYSVAGKARLAADDYEIVHGGYDAAFAAENPDRLVPLDAARALERAGEVGAVLDAYYVTCGNHGVLSQMQQHAREIAADLRRQHVDAVLLVAT